MRQRRRRLLPEAVKPRRKGLGSLMEIGLGLLLWALLLVVGMVLADLSSPDDPQPAVDRAVGQHLAQDPPETTNPGGDR